MPLLCHTSPLKATPVSQFSALLCLLHDIAVRSDAVSSLNERTRQQLTCQLAGLIARDDIPEPLRSLCETLHDEWTDRLRQPARMPEQLS